MKTLGIVRETKNRWEARVPLNPKAAKKLIQKGFEVIVQPATIRIYREEEYKKVGAVISDDLSNCDLILGVKEIHIPDLIPGIPHLFFAHVIKGQDYNMPMLQYMLDNKITLFDYEKIVDKKSRRLVFFGKFAGNAGMIDTLWGLGHRLKLQHRIDTPFFKVKRAYEYETVHDAIEHLKIIGKEIEENGLPEEITPLNIFILGYGHVAYGCREILNALPIIEIDPENLAEHQKNYQNNKVYLSNFKEKHLVERKDGNEFELEHFFDNCAEYYSRFYQYLPYCSVYMNAIFWKPDCPVYLKKTDLEKIQGEKQKLVIIGDISCDINGSVQATVKATYPDNPIFIYNAKTGEASDGLVGEGFADMTVDNLPCEFSKEASDYFSKILEPFIEKLLVCDCSKSIEEADLPDEIKGACITHQGKLQPEYEYLEEFLKI
ncbi:MAG: hypothetical protein ISS80_03350 [Candidatus Cloacimonetes bacterium]|nr:hypothetical protein [Candidatus Cloacimonadota bacterium]